MQLRGNIGKSLQQLAIWALIFIGVVAAYGLWNDIERGMTSRQSVMADGRIEIPMGPDGHYHATLQINGQPVRFVVDTGASAMVLSREDAARVGLAVDDLAYVGQAFTANGAVATAPVRLDSVSLGPFIDDGFRAVVNGGQMDGSLLGMDYLRLYSHIEISANMLVLTR